MTSMPAPTLGFDSYPSTGPAHPQHVARVFDDEVDLVDRVFQYASRGLLAGDAVVLALRPGHRAAIEERLLHARFDLDEFERVGTYSVVSATDLVEQILGAGRPKMNRVLDVAAPLFARGATLHSRVWAFAEVVDVLAEDGRESEAFELERIWNQVLARSSFRMMCGYTSRALRGPREQEARGCIDEAHARLI